MKIKFSQEVIVRFWAKVEVCSHGKMCRKCCWEWKGGRKVDSGYGYFNVPGYGKKERAHRVSWIILKNHRHSIPDGVQILHACDNPPCASPWHLFAGNHDTNMQDKKSKKRLGTTGTKFTPKTAKEVRKLFVTGNYKMWELAEKFNSARVSVSNILHGVSWRLLNDGLQEEINVLLEKKDRSFMKRFKTDKKISLHP